MIGLKCDFFRKQTHLIGFYFSFKNLLIENFFDKAFDWFSHFNEDGPYEARFGSNWWQEIENAIGKGPNAVICVTKLLQHAIDEGNCVFADTPYRDTWVIYHDTLSAWWSKEAQVRCTWPWGDSPIAKFVDWSYECWDALRGVSTWRHTQLHAPWLLLVCRFGDSDEVERDHDSTPCEGASWQVWPDNPPQQRLVCCQSHLGVRPNPPEDSAGHSTCLSRDRHGRWCAWQVCGLP